MSIQFERDTEGQIVREAQTVSGKTHWVEHQYDLEGNLAGRRTSLGHIEEVARNGLGMRTSTRIDGREVRHDSDLMGNELGLHLAGGGAIRNKYDALGRLVERGAESRGRELGLFPSGQPSWIGERRENVTAFKAFRYSADGELIETRDATRGSTELKYDPVGQLLAMVPEKARAELFRYDVGGNVHEADADRRYGAGSRLLRKGDTEYEWDADGRLAVKRIRSTDDSVRGLEWRYRWNGAGLLSRVERNDGVNVSFRYDPFARRLEKVVYRQPSHLAKPVVETRTRFVWDGDSLVHEIRENARKEGDPIVEERTYWFEDDGFEPIAHSEKIVATGVESSERWFYYFNDASGTPERLLNEDGSVAAEYARAALGQLAAFPGADAQTPIRMLGQYWDEETGLSYNRWRYYDPSAGTFVSPDPLGPAGGLQSYGYGPNTFGWIDPFGLVKAPAKLPNDPGIYILTNNVTGKAYVGSAGIGKQGMNQRISSAGHEEAQKLLADPNTKVQFVRVCNLPEVKPGMTKAERRAVKSARNNILRHHENAEFQRVAALTKGNGHKKYDMENTAGIQDEDKVASTKALITENGVTKGRRSTARMPKKKK